MNITSRMYKVLEILPFLPEDLPFLPEICHFQNGGILFRPLHWIRDQGQQYLTHILNLLMNVLRQVPLSVATAGQCQLPSSASVVIITRRSETSSATLRTSATPQPCITSQPYFHVNCLTEGVMAVTSGLEMRKS